MGLLELVASNIVLRIVCLLSDFVLLGIFNFIKKKIQLVKNGVPEDPSFAGRRCCSCWGGLRSQGRRLQVSGCLRRGGTGRRRLRTSGDVRRIDAVPGLRSSGGSQGGEADVANGLRRASSRHGSCRDALEVRVDMDRVVTPWRWCEEVVPPEPEISTAAVPPVVDEPRPVAPTANLAVVHVPASKTPFVARAPPSTQQSVVVAQEVPHVIRAPSSTPEVTVNIKHGVAHVEADVDPWTAMVLVFMGLGGAGATSLAADVDPWTAMVLVFMGLGGAGATSLAVFLVWLVKFIRNKSSYMRELVRMLTPEDQQDPEAQPVEDLLGLEEADKTVEEKQKEELSSYMRELVRMLTPEDQQDPEAQPVEDLLGLEEADKTVEEKKEEQLVLEDNNPFKEMLDA
ncbi:unnamed protein product [Notodromas monacha]|uniref:Transmembrane protein n=1 Tax=Notodromas monacha TaxID=399045 RepID=A0A7R9BEJ5_9CRUS|nr:unnamed protein product [Notodromas monacha]CAG0912707.1 unnamed protein product [Notodromas monacha]